MRTLRYFIRLLREFLDFARHNKAWWIVPLAILFLALAALLVATQGILPYLYPVF